MSAQRTVGAGPTIVLEQLLAAREWLSDPEHWTRGKHGISADGRPVHPIRAVKTCASGALIRFGCAPHEPAYQVLSRALGDTVCAANDRQGYDFIMVGFDKAIAAERARLEASAP